MSRYLDMLKNKNMPEDNRLNLLNPQTHHQPTPKVGLVGLVVPPEGLSKKTQGTTELTAPAPKVGLVGLVGTPPRGLEKTQRPESTAAPVPDKPLPSWLDELAELLRCEPVYLLSSGAIDCHDLIEQDGSNPQAMADLIRSNPDWKPQLNWKAIGRQYAKAHPISEAKQDDPWTVARDAFHHHWASCLDCYPPTSRYCPTGAALKERYEAITDQDRELTA